MLSPKLNSSRCWRNDRERGCSPVAGSEARKQGLNETLEQTVGHATLRSHPGLRPGRGSLTLLRGVSSLSPRPSVGWVHVVSCVLSHKRHKARCVSPSDKCPPRTRPGATRRKLVHRSAPVIHVENTAMSILPCLPAWRKRAIFLPIVTGLQQGA